MLCPAGDVLSLSKGTVEFRKFNCAVLNAGVAIGRIKAAEFPNRQHACGTNNDENGRAGTQFATRNSLFSEQRTKWLDLRGRSLTQPLQPSGLMLHKPRILR
jgi:hypothetical protein